MPFISSLSPSLSEQNNLSIWFIFSDLKLFIVSGKNGITVPVCSDIGKIISDCSSPVYFGSLNGYSCYAAEHISPNHSEISSQFAGLRSLFGQLPDDVFSAAGYALHLLNWEKVNRYCSRCGHFTVSKPDERAKICPNCDFVNYPKISPAVIAAVVKEDQILLARSSRYINSKIYSVIAGYLEMGETLEECVRREVKEEVGVMIRNIKYFGSQPWPCSNSVMIAFTAEYAVGEIQADNDEISDAGWFSADRLPEIPPKGSIASQLIEWFVFQKRSGAGRIS